MDDAQRRDRLESALLTVGRQPPALARLLRTLLPPASCAELVRAAGRRRAGATDDALALAHAAIRAARPRSAVVERILAGLPDGPAPPEALLRPECLPHLSRRALLACLAADLTGPDEEAWSRAGARLEEWQEYLGQAQDPAPARAAPRPAATPPPPPAWEGERAALEERLRQAQQEINRLQDQAGEANRLRQGSEAALAAVRQDLQAERLRAAGLKRRLDGLQAPGDREQQLTAALAEAGHARHVLEQKLRILREETRDLRAGLLDLAHYQTLDEEVPSFRDRPLQPEENDLAARLASRKEAGGRRFRILVVGGGEPQFRHRDKFEEYAALLGFDGAWRMADYTSWHRELKTLAKEMDARYDALVILHWNRTTFTHKAREICNHAGQKPCITCHYEGFVSLRRSLQETLRQLLAAAQP